MLTNVQIDFVTASAKQVAGEMSAPNERTLFERVWVSHGGIFDRSSLRILQFCAEEVAYQHEGALAIAGYFEAWKHALDCQSAGRILDVELLNELAAKIEPAVSVGGSYRTRAARIGGKVVGSSPRRIRSDMSALDAELQFFACHVPTENYARHVAGTHLYERFLTIHPRVNGNDREGKLLYNWIAGKLEMPSFPGTPKRFQ